MTKCDFGYENVQLIILLIFVPQTSDQSFIWGADPQPSPEDSADT